MLRDDLSIVYSTCDAYSSLWPGFFILLMRYWPNCDLPIIFNTESIHYRHQDLNVSEPVYCSQDTPWSKRLRLALEKVQTEYVLLMLDDFYLKSRVDVLAIEECIREMKRDPDCSGFTFAWQPGPNYETEICGSKGYEVRGRFARYRINAQISIYRLSYLKRILRDCETPWQFEVNGSFRSSLFGGKLYSVKKDRPLIFDYDHGFLIIRGKLNKKVQEYFNMQEKLNLDLPFAEFLDSDTPAVRNIFNRTITNTKYGINMILSIFKHE